MQPMQLIQCRDTAGFTVQGGARQGCTVPTQPRVRLSVRACPPRAAPGQAGGAVSGVWGLWIGTPYVWWGWRGSRPGGTASLYIHLHALSAAGEWSVRSPICSAAHIISWLVSEPAPRRGGSRAQRGEGRMLPSPPSHVGRLGAWEDPAPRRSCGQHTGHREGCGWRTGSIPMGFWDAAVLQASPGQCEGHRASPRPSRVLATF